MNPSRIRDGAILAVAALLVLCCPSSLLAQDSCSTSINPGYCHNCYTDAELMAIMCALTGNCTLSDAYAYLDNCLANTPPPFPPPPTTQSGITGCEGTCGPGIMFLDTVALPPAPGLQDANGNIVDYGSPVDDSTVLARIDDSLYAAAVGLAFVNVWIAYALYAGVAVMWLVPDRRFTR